MSIVIYPSILIQEMYLVVFQSFCKFTLYWELFLLTRIITDDCKVRSNILVKIVEGVNNNRFRNTHLQICNFGRYIFNMTHILDDILTFNISYCTP